MLMYLASFPGLPTVQFLIACSVQKRRGKAGIIYHVIDVSVYLGRTDHCRKMHKGIRYISPSFTKKVAVYTEIYVNKFVAWESFTAVR